MSFFVRTADREIRQRIIDDLEKVGFTPDNHSNKSDILESRFPLSIRANIACGLYYFMAKSILAEGAMADIGNSMA